MSINYIDLDVLGIPDPQFSNSTNFTEIQEAYAQSYWKASEILTAAINTGYPGLTGFLYVPTLSPPNSACGNSSSSLIIPGNVTTLDSFPPNRTYPLIAIFPWINAPCVQAYLAQAARDAVNAAITFQLTGSTLKKHSDPSWLLSDYSNWNRFPVVAITAFDAIHVLNNLSYYSGTMSEVPSSYYLLKYNDPHDLPRISAEIGLSTSGNGIPQWIIFIVVIVCVVLLVLGMSLFGGLKQRRLRQSLHDRIQRGEVDLEWLGIKNLNVPQEAIDAMPKYMYAAPSQTTAAADASATQQQQQPTNETFSSSSQLSCPICLDDFTNQESTVRELPCKHIFHPECIDLYLRDNSSLCPMCKKSALPPDVYPIEVTDAMVRRERLMQRLYEQHQRHLAVASAGRDGTMPASQAVSSTTTADATNAASDADIEMGALGRSPDTTGPAPTTDAGNEVAVPAEVAAQGILARRTWHRERLARRQQQFFAEASENTRLAAENRPLWRMAVGRIVPSVA